MIRVAAAAAAVAGAGVPGYGVSLKAWACLLGVAGAGEEGS